MNNNYELLAGIIENPTDRQIKLVYTDWLEENGEEERAFYIRKCIAGYHPLNYLIVHHNKNKSKLLGIDPSVINIGQYTVEMVDGFIHTFSCDLNDWLEFGKDLVKLHPIHVFTPDDKNPLQVGSLSGNCFWLLRDANTNKRNRKHSLPRDIYDSLNKHRVRFNRYRRERPGRKEYFSLEMAMQDLSEVCMNIAK